MRALISLMLIIIFLAVPVDSYGTSDYLPFMPYINTITVEGENIGLHLSSDRFIIVPKTVAYYYDYIVTSIPEIVQSGWIIENDIYTFKKDPEHLWISRWSGLNPPIIREATFEFNTVEDVSMQIRGDIQGPVLNSNLIGYFDNYTGTMIVFDIVDETWDSWIINNDCTPSNVEYSMPISKEAAVLLDFTIENDLLCTHISSDGECEIYSYRLEVDELAELDSLHREFLNRSRIEIGASPTLVGDILYIPLIFRARGFEDPLLNDLLLMKYDIKSHEFSMCEWTLGNFAVSSWVDKDRVYMVEAGGILHEYNHGGNSFGSSVIFAVSPEFMEDHLDLFAQVIDFDNNPGNIN